MKKSILKSTALCAALALLSGVAFAQTSSDPSSSSSSDPSSSSSSSSDPSSSSSSSSDQSGSSGSQSAGQKMKTVQMSKLLKANVKTAKGENLGKINEFVANPQTGEIQFVIIGVGGTAGIGEQLKPIPFKAITVRSEQDCVANIDRAKLESGPAIRKERMSDLQNPDYVMRLYTFYGMQPPSSMGGAGSQGGAGQGGGQGGGSSSNQPSSSSQPDSSSSSSPGSSSSSSGASPKQ
jgi:sporulation protein YlmC with PRC-barrel domain